MELCDFYPPTTENITNANRAISASVKARDYHTLEFLRDIFEIAQNNCEDDNDLAGAQAYGDLIIRATNLAHESGSAASFLERH